MSDDLAMSILQLLMLIAILYMTVTIYDNTKEMIRPSADHTHVTVPIPYGSSAVKSFNATFCYDDSVRVSNITGKHFQDSLSVNYFSQYE